MAKEAKVASVASLIGDPARANIMLALMDGRAHTAKELAFAAHVGAPTASAHLARLLDANFVAVVRRGRFRYYRIASPAVARMIEATAAVAAETVEPGNPPPVGDPIRVARTCYDHLAGRLGVAIADSLQDAGAVVLTEEGGEVTTRGRRMLASIGISLPEKPGRRVLCRTCLDWTERRYHLGGTIGALICDHALERGWVERMRSGRALKISDVGRKAFAENFKIAGP